MALIALLLPSEPPNPKGGRPRVPDRAALTGIIFALKSGIPREMPPPELGCGSGAVCWLHLGHWRQATVWEALHRTLLDRLGEADHFDLSQISLDGASILTKGGRNYRLQPDGPRQAPEGAQH